MGVSLRCTKHTLSKFVGCGTHDVGILKSASRRSGHSRHSSSMRGTDTEPTFCGIQLNCWGAHWRQVTMATLCLRIRLLPATITPVSSTLHSVTTPELTRFHTIPRLTVRSSCPGSAPAVNPVTSSGSTLSAAGSSTGSSTGLAFFGGFTTFGFPTP